MEGIDGNLFRKYLRTWVLRFQGKAALDGRHYREDVP
jgi:hypothetical protein